MNKETKELIHKKKLKLIDLKFFSENNLRRSWNYSKEQKLIQGSTYPINEWHWLHMEYMIATPTDVRDQCNVCGIRPQLTSKLKPIIVGDLIVRNGKGTNFNSYHVPCAITMMKEMCDKLLQTMARSCMLTPILHEQEMRKNYE
jgi:hypothetical protein